MDQSQSYKLVYNCVQWFGGIFYQTPSVDRIANSPSRIGLSFVSGGKYCKWYLIYWILNSMDLNWFKFPINPLSFEIFISNSIQIFFIFVTKSIKCASKFAFFWPFFQKFTSLASKNFQHFSIRFKFTWELN